MKKLFAIMLALMLVLTMGSALAEGGPIKIMSITKSVSGSGAASYPGETLTLTSRCVEVTDAATGVTFENAPNLTLGSLTLKAGETAGSFSIAFPDYTSVGIYTYEIKETAGTVAGVTYDPDTIKLVVTVINGSEEGTFEVQQAVAYSADNQKLTEVSFTNEYATNNLTVKKTVAGTLGDHDKEFNFTVKLTGDAGKTYNADGYEVTIAGLPADTKIKVDDSTAYSFSLSHGETFEIKNLPVGVTYTVEEADYSDDGYETTIAGEETRTATGTISSEASSSVEVTNTRDAAIATGITTDNLPYIVLMGIVVLAGVAMIAKRRMAHND